MTLDLNELERRRSDFGLPVTVTDEEFTALIAAARERDTLLGAVRSLDCLCTQDEGCDRCWLMSRVERTALAGRGA